MKIAYYIIKSLLSLMVLGSATMYLTSTESVAAEFTSLGFPTWIITPLAIAKILGIVALWDLVKVKWAFRLKDFAYAGFTYNFLLASGAHYNVGDGEFGAPLAALVLLIAVIYLRCKVDEKEGKKPACCS